MNLKKRFSSRVVLFQNIGTGNVTGHQVGRELNPVEVQADGLGQR